jgi:zinc protease
VERDRLDGAITLHSYAATAETKRAMDLTFDILHRFAEEGISADQLAAARTYIKATYPPENLQTAGQLADVLGELELYGLGREEIDGLFAQIDAVTLQQANRVLRRYYGRSKPVVVLIGRAGQLRQQMRGYAPAMAEASVVEPGFLRAAQGEPTSESKR